jgi:hypothetical protein
MRWGYCSDDNQRESEEAWMAGVNTLEEKLAEV